MKQILTLIGMLLVLTAGGAFAAEINLPATTDPSDGYLASSSAKSVDLTLVAAPAARDAADAANELPPELEPTLLRERAFTEASAFAGFEVALPTSPLSIVLAADDLLNPACGLKLHLVW